MHRLASVLSALALVGAAMLAQSAVGAPTAAADGGASNCSSAMLLCTTIQYSGSHQLDPRDPAGPGGDGGSGGYVSSCWLQPLTALNDPDQQAATPKDLAQYFTDLHQAWSGDPDFDTWYGQVQEIYQDGRGGDPGINLVTTPYNEGTTGGSWYAIACDMDTYKYSDYVAVQKAMGVSDGNLDYEGWFWITDPGKLPESIIVTPGMLAQYAANHVAVTPSFPELSPDAATTQTVKLPVESVNAAGARGYHTYSTTASLAGIQSTVTSYPVTVTYTATPAGLISPASVTCQFNKNGSIKKGCGTFVFTRPEAASAGARLIATTTWKVTWVGSAEYGQTGWTIPLPGAEPVFTQVVQVQAIQAINVATAPAAP